MKKIPLFSVAALLMLFLTLTASAQETRSFNLSGFDKVSMGSAFRIEIKQGSKYSISTTGRSEDLEDLEATVKGDALHLGYKDHKWNKNRKTVNVNITMPALEAVDFSGACKAYVAPFSGVKSMEIEISGASQVNMELSAPKVALELSGASSLVLVGKGDVLSGEVSGASSFKGRDFAAKTVNIDASGASSAAVMASNAVHADASGASSIRYSGEAKDIRSSTSGASSVKRD
ncbi:head GIN domain-containing protein [Dyadobacter alkalitolerans]|uniref:head GIN domain-containing protein n=1 Tax=Dyadobacter alkalitolerans TaxID=492736 RepID=UPI00047BA234|nr:head GIN domain-containing protein [Dyadobacter alkalitolerans]